MEKQTVKILRYNSRGAGVGVLKGGKTVFVPYAVAGETVEVTVTDEKKSFASARLERIAEPSSDRVKPACSVYGKCGGCALMHIGYNKQLEIKRDTVRGCLGRIAGIDAEVLDVFPSPDTAGCRNKAALQLSPDRNTEIGFYAADSRNVIGINSCPVCGDWLTPAISVFKKYLGRGVPIYDCRTGKGLLRHIVARAFGKSVQICAVVNGTAIPQEKALISMLSEKYGSFSLLLNVNTAGSGVILGDKTIALYGNAKQAGSLAGISYSAAINSFLQINPKVAAPLYLKALELSEVSGSDTVIDAYSGIGVLTAIFARRARLVYGIETVPSAVADADGLMRENGIENVRNILADCGTELPRLVKTAGRGLTVILDPPRKGCDKTVTDALVRNPVRKIIYISCDPATLARDLKPLIGSGKYALSYCRPFDMFPHTADVETLVCIDRR